MKHFVDKFPKNCVECSAEFCKHQFVECCYENRHPNCPLKLKKENKNGSKNIKTRIKRIGPKDRR